MLNRNSAVYVRCSHSLDEPERLARRRFFKSTLVGAAGVLLVAHDPVLAEAATMTGEQIVRKPSPEAQKKVGRLAADKILRQFVEVHDSRADQFRNMGQRLVAALSEDERHTWDFNFHVLESKEINAFALPGGPMFMFTGLANLLASVDALAGVTGHEMTHVRKEHWAKAYSKNASRGALLGFGLAVLRAGQLAQSLTALADNAMSKKYSRDEESEADAGGLENMVNAGFNPQGMLELFETLRKAAGNGGGGITGDFLADHPLTSDRISKTKERIAAYGDRVFPPLTPLNFAPPGAGQTLSPPVLPPTPP